MTLIQARPGGGGNSPTAGTTLPYYVIDRAVGAAVADDISLSYAVTSGYKEIVVPAGSYITSLLTLSTVQRWILLNGATITGADAGSSQVILITAAGVHIEGEGTVDGNFAGLGAGTPKAAIQFSSTASDGRVEGITINNARLHGIYGLNATRLNIAETTITDSHSNGIYVEVTAASAGDLTDLVITRNRVDRSSLGAALTAGGIKVHTTSTSNKVTRSRLSNNLVLMPLSPTASGTNCIEVFGGCDRATISNNETHQGAQGISIDRSPGTAATGNVVYSPDRGSSTAGVGIEIAGSDFVTVTGNTIDGGAILETGIACWDNAADAVDSDSCTITANIIRNLSSVAASVGIQVSSATVAVNRAAVSANVIDMTGCFTGSFPIVANKANGLNINGNNILGSANTARLIKLLDSTAITANGNTMSGGATSAFFIQNSTLAPTDITMTGNVINSSTVALATSGTMGSRIRFHSNTGDASGARDDILDVLTNLRRQFGTGSPESSVTAGIGSEYIRTDGGAATTHYFKESGTGNTGWAAK